MNLLFCWRKTRLEIQYVFYYPEWAIDSEAMREKGIIVLFSKIQLVGQKNIETKHLSQVKKKLDFNPLLPLKHYKYGRRFSPLVGYNI